MLLHYISSEEDVFFCLLKIMGDLNWRQHFLKPYRQPDIVKELHELISLSIPNVYTKLEQDGLLDSLLNNLYNYAMPSMCTGGYIPIEISARIFELIAFEDYGDVTLVRLIIYMLMIQEKKILSFEEESERFKYISHGQFIVECIGTK